MSFSIGHTIKRWKRTWKVMEILPHGTIVCKRGIWPLWRQITTLSTGRDGYSACFKPGDKIELRGSNNE